MRPGWFSSAGRFRLRMTPIDDPSPMSQALADVSSLLPLVRSVSSPKTSDIDSLIAPDCQRYCRPDVRSVTPWVSSWAVMSSVTTPRPNAIWVPSQNAFGYGHLRRPAAFEVDVAHPHGAAERLALAVLPVVADEGGEVDAAVLLVGRGGVAEVGVDLVDVRDARGPLPLGAPVGGHLAVAPVCRWVEGVDGLVLEVAHHAVQRPLLGRPREGDRAGPDVHEYLVREPGAGHPIGDDGAERVGRARRAEDGRVVPVPGRTADGQRTGIAPVLAQRDRRRGERPVVARAGGRQGRERATPRAAWSGS